MRGSFYVDSAASDWVARVRFVGRPHRTQSPLFSGLNGRFKSRIPSKGSYPSMFQSGFPSGPGTALFTAANPHSPCWAFSWQSLRSALALLYLVVAPPPTLTIGRHPCGGVAHPHTTPRPMGSNASGLAAAAFLTAPVSSTLTVPWLGS